jgi:hypothetical protein
MNTKALDATDMIELYAASSAMEAERIVLILEDEGVEALARALSASSFPADVSSQHLIVVQAPDRDKAKEAIAKARADGVITVTGDFL